MNQTATYCPEDDKLRLYVGRVPRDEYEALRAQGWTATPKQECNFVAVWTPDREATALEYSNGIIEDEDQSPADRAADRAERFSEYRDKRHEEATGHADRFESGPMLHGYQSAALAERRANQHDRIATRAVNSWGKAEYWQQRTAGVISHALHVSTPGVRMGRIKDLEAELRKAEKNAAEQKARWDAWTKILAMTDTEKQNAVATELANYSHGTYMHPRPDEASAYVREHGTGLWSLLTDEKAPITGKEAAELWLAQSFDPATHENPWATHYRLRLAYENQMLEAQGGRAAFVEMEAGGWLGTHQIQRVVKSPATGRVVSVQVLAPLSQNYCYDSKAGKYYGPDHPRPIVKLTINIERMKSDVYRAPTDEERAAFAESKKSAKKEQAKAPKGPSLVNPTLADAEKLQELWNAHHKAKFDAQRHYMGEVFKPATVCQIKQATYSANSGGNYARAETRELCKGGKLKSRTSNMYSGSVAKYDAECGPVLCKIRVTGYAEKKQVIVIMDKPQKSLPVACLEV